MTKTNDTTDHALTLEYFSAHPDACILDLAVWLRAKYDDRFATFDEYCKAAGDVSYARSLVWAWATHQYVAEVQGFLAGWGFADWNYRETGQCESCLAFVPVDTLKTAMPSAGVEGSFCASCRGVATDNEPDCPACGAHVVFGGRLTECAARCGWQIDRAEAQ